MERWRVWSFFMWLTVDGVFSESEARMSVHVKTCCQSLSAFQEFPAGAATAVVGWRVDQHDNR